MNDLTHSQKLERFVQKALYYALNFAGCFAFLFVGYMACRGVELQAIEHYELSLSPECRKPIPVKESFTPSPGIPLGPGPIQGSEE